MKSKKILFICTGNAFRAPVAEALLKKLRPEISADSAGTHPSLQVSEAAHKRLAEENAEGFLKDIPEGLDNKQLDEYSLIIAMEPQHRDAVLRKCPDCGDRVVVWNINDPVFFPPEYNVEVFKQIKDKVKELADSL
jgi:protein-tyrosine-phosphatase